MGRRFIPEEHRQRFFLLISQGVSIKEAAADIGISPYTGYEWVKKTRHNRVTEAAIEGVREEGRKGGKQNRAAKAELAQAELGGPIPHHLLSEPAKRGLRDFAFFRSYYLGRAPSPWQTEAGVAVADHLDSPEREFVVLNVPPGAGKSTLMHDAAVWCIVRNRAVRILIGSISKPLADQYAARIRDTLAAIQPMRPPTDLIRKGLAVDAQGCIARDYGRFKPVGKEQLWRRDQFVVEQHDNDRLDNKEPTVSSYGIESEFIGHRADLCLYDDVVNDDNSRDGATKDRLFLKWDNQAEARCEPGGALFLVGQRLAPNDLYFHCLNKVAYDEDDIDDDGNPTAHKKYKQVKYAAYYPELDTGPDSRKPTAPAWPNGPLLDPLRLPWRDLNQIRQNTPTTFDIVYQQEDTDAALSLVQRVWAYGGYDKETGITYTGCIDQGRLPQSIPVDLPSGAIQSIATVDPSPTEYWGIEWWLRPIDDPANRRYLIDLERRRQTAEDLLGYDTQTGEWIGLMEEWQLRSVQLGRPITHWVVEINAAQRFLLAHDYVRQWQRARKVHIVAHTTSSNKLDAKRGVEALLPPLWRHGQVRLPDLSSWKTTALINEVTTWKPEKKRGTDLVMAHWFAELHWPSKTPRKPPQPAWRPSFLREPTYA